MARIARSQLSARPVLCNRGELSPLADAAGLQSHSDQTKLIHQCCDIPIRVDRHRSAVLVELPDISSGDIEGLAGRGHPEHHNVLAQRRHGLGVAGYAEIAANDGEVGLAVGQPLGACGGALGRHRPQPALVRAAAFRGRDFAGKVVFIAPIVEPGRINSRGQRSVTDVAVRPALALAIDASFELGWPLSAIHAARSVNSLAASR